MKQSHFYALIALFFLNLAVASQCGISYSVNQTWREKLEFLILSKNATDEDIKEEIVVNFDVIGQTHGDYTLLTYAVMTDRAELVEYLLDNKADITHVDGEGNGFLHEAARYANPRSAQKLLDRGIKIDSQNKRGQTALHLAARGYCVETVKLLLEYKSKVDIADNDGLTPRDISLAKNNQEYITLLEDAAKN